MKHLIGFFILFSIPAQAQIARYQPSNTVISSQTVNNLEKVNYLIVVQTATVQGNAFSVGGSTFTIANGTITVGSGMTINAPADNTTAVTISIPGSTSGPFVHVQRADNAVKGEWNYDGATGAEWLGSTSNHDFYLRSNNTDRLHILSGGNVGVGTTGPATKMHMSSGTLTIDGNVAPGLNIQTNIATPNTLQLQVSSQNTVAMFGITSSGHIQSDQTAVPTVSANCTMGSGSSDVAGSVAIAGGATSACTITFQEPFANAPFCVATDATANSAIKVTPATNSLIVTLPAAANDTIDYICMSR